MKTRWIILGIVAALLTLASVGVWVWRARQTPPAPKTATVQRTNIRVSFGLDGALAIESYTPQLTLSGRVARVLVQEGQTVQQGQWLLTLDTAEAQKNLEKTLLDYSKERNDFDQDVQVTYADRVVTDTLRRILEKNQWDLNKAVLDVELKDLALTESRLKAPTSGIVSAINVQAGDVVSTQNQGALVTITKPHSFTFVASAEEVEMLKITPEMKTTITLDAYPEEEWPAKITFVSPIAARDTNGIVSYPVKATFTDLPTEKILDGMEGSLTFVTKEVSQVLAIPTTAVNRDGTQAYVTILADGKTARRDVTTGFTNGKEVEITQGLTAGERVVLP